MGTILRSPKHVALTRVMGYLVDFFNHNALHLSLVCGPKQIAFLDNISVKDNSSVTQLCLLPSKLCSEVAIARLTTNLPRIADHLSSLWLMKIAPSTFAKTRKRSIKPFHYSDASFSFLSVERFILFAINASAVVMKSCSRLPDFRSAFCHNISFFQ